MDEPWIRALHALYYGRVYVWNGERIISIHRDRLTNRNQVFGPVDVSSIYFDTVDSWYKGMPGTYETARFNDPNFWKAEEPKTRRQHQKKAPNDTENFWREEFERQKRANPNQGQHSEDVYAEFREAFNAYQRQYTQDNPPPRPSYRPTSDKWFNMLIAEGSLEGAKKKYKELAKQYHPDLNSGSNDALANMQDINRAYEKIKEYLR